MVLDTSLLNTRQYKVRIKGKVEQSSERSSALTLHLSVVAIEKGAFWSPSTKVANFTFYLYIYMQNIYIYIWFNHIYMMFVSIFPGTVSYACHSRIYIYIYIYIYMCVCVCVCVIPFIFQRILISKRRFMSFKFTIIEYCTTLTVIL